MATLYNHFCAQKLWTQEIYMSTVKLLHLAPKPLDITKPYINTKCTFLPRYCILTLCNQVYGGMLILVLILIHNSSL